MSSFINRLRFLQRWIDALFAETITIDEFETIVREPSTTDAAAANVATRDASTAKV